MHCLQLAFNGMATMSKTDDLNRAIEDAIPELAKNGLITVLELFGGSGEKMMDIVERLRMTPETGADPDMIFEAADEIERLRDALKKANEQAERFERELYLRGDAGRYDDIEQWEALKIVD